MFLREEKVEHFHQKWIPVSNGKQLPFYSPLRLWPWSRTRGRLRSCRSMGFSSNNTEGPPSRGSDACPGSKLSRWSGADIWRVDY
ncbi:hypothetical protein TNCV_2534771 [Trichonephila clavipes]|nr:hypothetical protein TNCV_2534771 [Trichonephila clavipes]